MAAPYKMKGYSYPGTSPVKNKNKKTTTIFPKDPKTNTSITNDEYDVIVSDPKTKKSYVSGYNKMTKAEKIKHKKPVEGTYLINKYGNIKKLST